MKLFIIVLVVLLAGCSTSHIMRDCKAVSQDEQKFVCKNIKPWE